MTVDTSNPDKLTWGEMPREVKAEILMQWDECKTVQWLDYDGSWHDDNDPEFWPSSIYRINPEEKRETVTRQISGNGICVDTGRQIHAAYIEYETVNGEIDKSVQPRWLSND